MRKLEEFLKPTQKGLFKMLNAMFSNAHGVVSKDNFILVEGEVPIMLLAHLDTVHREPVRDICVSKSGNLLMSPQWICGDDRCGVYALVNAYELSAKKPWLLFTCDEEIGGVGAKAFCDTYTARRLTDGLNDLKMLIEIDRKGKNDAVYYDCDNRDFEEYITSKGFKTAYGSFSDISLIAPKLGVAAVNLSSGYYNAHQLHEYIVRSEINAVIEKVVEIIADVGKKDFPKYEYIEGFDGYFEDDYWHYGGYGEFFKRGGKEFLARSRLAKNQCRFLDFDDEDEYDDEIPPRKELPREYEEYYTALIDDEVYTIEELENLRACYGDSVIYEAYIETYQPFYKKTANGAMITAIDDK